MKHTVARLLIVTIVAMSTLLGTQLRHVDAAGETVSGSDSFVTQINEATPIDDITISGTGNPTVSVRLYVSSGSLEMQFTTGITFSGASTGSTLEFSGSLTDVNAALASLEYTRGSVGSDTLEVSLVDPGEVFFPDNGHLYEFVSSSLDWNAANTAAGARSKYNASGYLTTITSDAENSFVAERLEDAGWMGASDASVENTWRWVTGPENGTQFWSGLSNGSTVGGNYANWGTGEPNNSGNEDCAQFLTGGTGKWNDLPCSGFVLPGYVVEYGAAGDMPEVASHEATIYTVRDPDVNAPTADSLSNVLNVNVTLYSTPQSGTVQLILNGGTGHTITLTDLAVGSHSFTIDPNNIIASPYVAATSISELPEDTYGVIFRYTDAASGAMLDRTVTNVSLDPQPPEITEVSPLDNATDVAISSNISITFSESVSIGTGNILIKDVSDDSTAASIAVGSGQVTGSGTNTITINPTDNLDPGTDYYIEIPVTAFDDGAGNGFAGISDSTVFNFSTLDPPTIQCKQPVSTNRTFSGNCTITPSEGWGSITWEARYRLEGSDTYTDLTLTDDSIMEVEVVGLQPDTTYELHFRFTNDWGTSEWAYQTITTDNEPESDYNGDGTPDIEQPQLSSYISSLTGKRVVIDVGEGCELTIDDLVAESSLDEQDANYDYENGLFDFEADCGTPGYTTTVRLYYYDTAATDMIVRKFNPNSNEYFTISEATVASEEINGEIVTVASYDITDGGSLDMDGVADGMIVDPAGITSAPSDLADSGDSTLVAASISACLLLAAGSASIYIRRRNRRTHAS